MIYESTMDGVVQRGDPFNTRGAFDTGLTCGWRNDFVVTEPAVAAC